MKGTLGFKKGSVPFKNDLRIDHSDLMFIGVYVHLATLKDIQISICTLLMENYSVHVKEHKT